MAKVGSHSGMVFVRERERSEREIRQILLKLPLLHNSTEKEGKKGYIILLGSAHFFFFSREKFFFPPACFRQRLPSLAAVCVRSFVPFSMISICFLLVGGTRELSFRTHHLFGFLRIYDHYFPSSLSHSRLGYIPSEN